MHAHVTQGSEKLVEGMSISATIPTSNATMLAVPESAIAMSGNEFFIYLDDGGTQDGGQRFQEVPVILGPNDGGMRAITPISPLPENARIRDEPSLPAAQHPDHRHGPRALTAERY